MNEQNAFTEDERSKAANIIRYCKDQLVQNCLMYDEYRVDFVRKQIKKFGECNYAKWLQSCFIRSKLPDYMSFDDCMKIINEDLIDMFTLDVKKARRKKVTNHAKDSGTKACS